MKYFFSCCIICLILFFVFYTTIIKEETILSYYSDERDSLKKEAVLFLLNNIEGQESYIPKFTDQNNKEIDIHLDTISTEDLFWNLVQELNLSIDVIKSSDKKLFSKDNIIHNIDLSFYVWNKYPWADKVPKDIFFNYILAPKIFGEYPNNWRDVLFGKYNILADSLSQRIVNGKSYLDSNGIYYRFVVEELNNWFTYDPSATRLTPYQSFNELKAIGKGECFGGSYLGVYILRSLGIPATVDLVPLWGSRNGSHASEVFWDNNKQLFRTPFERELKYRRPAKVFRYSFKNQHTWTDSIIPYINDEVFLLDFIQHDHWLDVTNEHTQTFTVKYKLSKDIDTPFAYICVFNYGKWHPIYWGRISNNEVSFKNMGANILYRIAIPDGNNYKLISNIICVDSLNQDRRSTPNSIEKIRKMTLKKLNTGSLSWVKSGSEYSLYFWNKNNDWQLFDSKVCLKDSLIIFNSVPNNRYYRLLETKGAKKMARIFTYEDNLQYWW